MRHQLPSLEEVIAAALAPVVARATTAIERHVSRMVAAQIDAELSSRRPRVRAALRGVRRARPELQTWTADRRARRVPNFVIAATGLRTKREIVARYGEASFERGKPVPEPLARLAREGRRAPAANPVVKAKDPIIRRKVRPAA